MKKTILAALLLMPACLFAQCVTDVAIQKRGFGLYPAGGASVRVCSYSATPAAACTPLAIIYSDPGLTTPILNPVTADANGNYSFCAVGTTYTVQVTYQGQTLTQNTVTLGVSANDENAVKTTGNQTVAGDKTWTGYNLYTGATRAIYTATGDSEINHIFAQRLNPAANTSGYSFGLSTEMLSLGANSKNLGGQDIGIYGSFSHFGSGSVAFAAGGAFEGFNAGPGTATAVVGVNATANCGGVNAGVLPDPPETATNNGNCGDIRGGDLLVRNYSSGTVDYARGLYIEPSQNIGGGTVTTLYGIYVGSQTVGGTNYSIYTEGAAPSLFNGPVAIGGGTSITKVVSATATIDFANTVAPACTDSSDITMADAADGDVVLLGSPVPPTGGMYSAYVKSGGGAVRVRFCALVTGNPASATFRVDLVKH